MSIKPGDTILAYWGGTAAAAQTTHDFQPETQQRNTSHKQSGKFEESEPMRLSANVNLTILKDDEAAFGYADFFADWKSGAKKELKLSSEVVGDREHVGQAYITNVGQAAPDQENVECTVSFRYTGEISYAEITAP